jgi:hypothetical protein
MIHKLPVLLLFILAFSSYAQKQQETKKFSLKNRFISSVGFAYSILDPKEVLYGINTTPSLDLLNSFSDFSISMALNIGAGYHPSSNKDTLEYYSYSFPAFIQINAGHLASQDFYAAIGLFVGAGYNLTNINSELGNGFSWTAGFRFWLLKQSFTLHYVQSHLNLSSERLHEMSLQINVGKYLQRVKDNNKLSKFVSPFWR